MTLANMQFTLALSALFIARCLCITVFHAPSYEFLTRPDLKIPRLLVDSYNATAVAPGYIFMSPFSPEVDPLSKTEKVDYQFGPVIYDNHGELVWSGANASFPLLGTMGNFVCEYEGAPHLCFAHYTKNNPIHSDFLNASYDRVRSVWPTGQSDSLPLIHDLHEFNVIQGNNDLSATLPRNVHRNDTAIISSSTDRLLPIPVTISDCAGEVRWVESSVFQEISTDGEERVLFQWNSIDHIPITEVVQCPGHDPVYKDGASESSPFDYFHLNSVDKDSNGDYYLSARHTASLYKISGADGSVLWRLGLARSDFVESSEVEGVEFPFAYQHHVRVHEDYPGSDVANGIIALSIFDNANDDYYYNDKVADFSSGKVIMVNERAQTAVLKEAYTLLLGNAHQLSSNQGSFQLLPNGNRILGGGNIQEVIEWQPGNFEPVFRAHWGDWNFVEGGLPGHKINSYRSMRFEWQGLPRTNPNLLAYAPNCSSSEMATYVSWNGATEVTSWTFLGSDSASGPWRHIGSASHTGFETSGDVAFAKYVCAVAHDSIYHELGRSDPVMVTVPSSQFIQQGTCNRRRCQPGFNYTLGPNLQCDSRELSEDLGAPQTALSAEGNNGWLHCDPCFAPYKRFIRFFMW